MGVDRPAARHQRERDRLHGRLRAARTATRSAAHGSGSQRRKDRAAARRSASASARCAASASAALEAVLEARDGGRAVPRSLRLRVARRRASASTRACFEALVQCGAFDTTLAPRGITARARLRRDRRALERSRAARAGIASAGRRTSSACSTQRRSGARRAERPRSTTTPTCRAVGSARDARAREAVARLLRLGHPLDRYGDELGALSKLDAVPSVARGDRADWAMVRVAGMVEGYRERIFKGGGGKVAFFELEDLTGRVEVKVRGNQIETYAPVLTSGEPVLVSGKVSFPLPRRRRRGARRTGRGSRRSSLERGRPLVGLGEDRTRSRSNIRLLAEKTTPRSSTRWPRSSARSAGTCPVTLVLAMKDGAEAILSLGKAFRVEVERRGALGPREDLRRAGRRAPLSRGPTLPRDGAVRRFVVPRSSRWRRHELSGVRASE